MSQSRHPEPHADTVLALLATGSWSVSRRDGTWMAKRLQGPFWDANGTRYWAGPTAYDALMSAHAALGIAPEATPAAKSLLESQLGLYFAVGPAGDANDESNAERQTQSYAALEVLFNERGMSELGKADPTVSDDFRYLPFELCECEWDGQDVDGQVVYSVWFHSGSAIEAAAAAKLRAMALEAYTAVCGLDARFVRAEMYEKWTVSARTPVVFAD